MLICRKITRDKFFFNSKYPEALDQITHRLEPWHTGLD